MNNNEHDKTGVLVAAMLIVSILITIGAGTLLKLFITFVAR